MPRNTSQPFRLPVIELSRDRTTQNRLVGVVHFLRIATLILLLVGLHRLAGVRSERSGQSAPVTIDLQTAMTVHPDVASIEPLDGDSAAYQLLDANGDQLAIVTQTSPQSDSIVGYAGPSNVLVAMDGDLVVQSVRLLRCPDTAEHLRMVETSPKFWGQFAGWKWGETATVEVDGVTGSTLTSLAIGEAVAWRLSHPPGSPAVAPPLVRRSLRFSTPIDVESLTRWFEDVAEVREDDQLPFLLECLDGSGTILGKIVRTGPLDDSVIGFQGPTEVILQVQDSATLPPAISPDVESTGDSSPIVIGAMLGQSFDNQPYVNYVKQERSFWKRFRNRTIDSLAALDFEAEMIDGVSGATMTSMAVAETIRNASKKWIEIDEQMKLAQSPEPTTSEGPTRQRKLNTSWNEWLTGGIALAALLWSRSRLRGRRWTRLAWQVTMLISIGWLSGNLLSMALLGGWTRGGIAWHFAPGLATLAVISIFAPAILKGNVYCDHICPHGIIQQWIRPRKSRKIDPRLEAALRVSAVIFVVIALIAAVQPAWINLAWFEPFDTYASGVLFSISATVWLASIVLARFKPMGYCRLACPTGRLLDYTRRDASRYQLTILDGALIAGVIGVWLTLLYSP